MLKITMKDGAVREAEAGISIQDFVKQVSNSLAKKVLAAKVDGETKTSRPSSIKTARSSS